MSKQDRQGARTVTDLERKYNLRDYGEQFAMVAGIATDARKATEELEEEINYVKGELALKVGTNDSGELISMIEAYSDEIRLQANTLVITSDFFTLSRTGATHITSAWIDLATINDAKISDAEIIGGTIDKADISLANMSYATIKYGTIEDAAIERGTITEANITKGSLVDAEILKCRIAESYIGNVYFDKFTARTDCQMRFTDLGMFLAETDGTTNYSCFVWENNDGTNTLRMRVDNGKLFIESLGGYVGDLYVCGMSIREMFNKINELSEGGIKETLNLVLDGSTLSWNYIDGANTHFIYVDGVEYERTAATKYDLGTDTFVAMFGEGNHTIYVEALPYAGGEVIAKSNNVTYDGSGNGDSGNGGNSGGNTSLNLEIDGERLTWNLLDGAESYLIYVDGTYKQQKYFNVWTLDPDVLGGNGPWTIRVDAMSTTGAIIASETITYSIDNHCVNESGHGELYNVVKSEPYDEYSCKWTLEYYCDWCDWKSTSVEYPPHTFVNGVCTSCGYKQ